MLNFVQNIIIIGINHNDRMSLFRFFPCLSVAEGADVVVNLLAENVWDSEDELPGALSDEVKNWYLLCLYICPMYLPMTNSKTSNIKW